jgi:hypothetical protein
MKDYMNRFNRLNNLQDDLRSEMSATRIIYCISIVSIIFGVLVLCFT